MLHAHTSFELPGHNTQESNPVTVSRVHVRLNFEHITSEFLIRWFYYPYSTAAWFRLRCQIQEIIEESLYAEIVDRTTKEHRCEFTT
ncbi:hypothetical protein D3C76_1181140 [compost metagenome]